MPIQLFGYNGVFGVAEHAVNKLLARHLYEQNLVERDPILDGECLGPLVVALNAEALHVYLLLGKPSLRIETHDGTNGARLEVPFIGTGVYHVVNGVPVPLLIPPVSLTISGVTVTKSATGLSMDFAAVGKDQIALNVLMVASGPTDVGGTASHFSTLDDQVLDALFAANGVALTGSNLRDQLAAFLRAGALGPTSVPVAPGGNNSQLGNWDLMMFDEGGAGGADLLLFAQDNSGRGLREQAGDTVLDARTPPPFGWAFSMREDLLLNTISHAMDADRFGYFKQRGDYLNDKDHPFGYMVVPSVGTMAYALPSGPDAVTIRAPVTGQIGGAGTDVTIKAGGLAPRTRAALRNFDTGASIIFSASGDGGATVTTAAAAGQRLAISVEALPLPGDSSILVWRPTIVLKNGSLQVEARYHKAVAHFCDVEGAIQLKVGVRADRSKAFAFDLPIIEQEVGTPWWVDLGLFILRAIYPLLALSIRSKIEGAAGDDAGAYAGHLDDQISAAVPDGFTLVLDAVEVYDTGLVLSGRCDAGEIFAYDRAVVEGFGGGELVLPAVAYVRLEWTSAANSMAFSCRKPWALVVDQAAEKFWAASPDDWPLPEKFTLNPLTVGAGGSVMAWVEVSNGYCKLLFEHASATPSGSLVPQVTVTWIAYRRRTSRRVVIENLASRTEVSRVSNRLFEIIAYRYDGNIALDTRKFYLTPETRAAGQGRWFWNGVEVTTSGITLPMGTVRLHDSEHKLIVHFNQSSLASAGEDIQTRHEVRFVGTDVFGHEVDVISELDFPPIEYRDTGIDDQYNPPFRPGFVQPPESLLDVGALGFSTQLQRIMAKALSTGNASLDANAATELVAKIASLHTKPVSNGAGAARLTRASAVRLRLPDLKT